MGPTKDQCIHYEEMGDQFVGRSVARIYSLTTDFGISPVHWDLTDSPMGSKDEMVAFIEENFLRSTDVYSPTFEILQLLFACLRFHYTHLNTHIHKNHRLRESPIFIAAGREKNINKFLLTRYPWTSTTYTPYFKGIPTNFMLMSEIE